jgi:L-2,4-diaminobutyrate transaminase
MFGHGFTTAGHPVAAAVALANLDIIEREGLLSNSAETGAYLLEQLRQKLRGAAHLGEIRGKGLFAGIEFDEEPGARRPFSAPARISALLQQCLAEERVFLRSGHGRVVGAVAPALIATPADVDEIVIRVARAVGRFEERLPTCMGA